MSPVEPGEAEPVQVKGKATKPAGEVPFSRVGNVGEGVYGFVDAGVESGEPRRAEMHDLRRFQGRDGV